MSEDRDQVCVLCEEMICLCLDNPGMKTAIITTSSEWLYDRMLRALIPLLNEAAGEVSSYSIVDQNAKFENDSLLFWRAYTSPDKVRGWEAHTIWFDGTERGLDMCAMGGFVQSRLRATTPKLPTRWIVSHES